MDPFRVIGCQSRLPLRCCVAKQLRGLKVCDILVLNYEFSHAEINDAHISMLAFNPWCKCDSAFQPANAIHTFIAHSILNNIQHHVFESTAQPLGQAAGSQPFSGSDGFGTALSKHCSNACPSAQYHQLSYITKRDTISWSDMNRHLHTHNAAMQYAACHSLLPPPSSQCAPPSSEDAFGRQCCLLCLINTICHSLVNIVSHCCCICWQTNPDTAAFCLGMGYFSPVPAVAPRGEVL